MSYLLDANVFIQAKNLHYGLDFCPGFWEWLIQKGQNGTIFSIDKVADELKAGADELTLWAQQHGHNIFRQTDTTVSMRFSDVSTWVTSQQYEPAAISTFMQAADFYLIAHALTGNHTVVTHEVPSDSLKKIKIPNACIGLGVRFMTVFEMLRIEQARFVLP